MYTITESSSLRYIYVNNCNNESNEIKYKTYLFVIIEWIDNVIYIRLDYKSPIE